MNVAVVPDTAPPLTTEVALRAPTNVDIPATTKVFASISPATLLAVINPTFILPTFCG